MTAPTIARVTTKTLGGENTFMNPLPARLVQAVQCNRSPGSTSPTGRGLKSKVPLALVPTNTTRPRTESAVAPVKGNSLESASEILSGSKFGAEETSRSMIGLPAAINGAAESGEIPFSLRLMKGLRQCTSSRPPDAGGINAAAANES